MKRVSRPLALGLMVLAPILWSIAGVVTRHMEQAQGFELVFWRSFFAGITVGAFLLIAGKPGAALRRAGWPGLLSGAMFAVMFTAFMLALTLTTVANTLVVMSVAPFITALSARLFLKEHIPGRTWAAIAAATVGLGWMFGSGLAAHSARDLLGMSVALLVPFASAVNVMTMRSAGTKVDLIPGVLIGAVISSAVTLPLALPFEGSARDIALLALLGFFQLGLPCMLMVVASRSLSAPEISLLALLEVLCGPLWAWLGAGEVPAATTLWGGGIVLGALVLNALSARRG